MAGAAGSPASASKVTLIWVPFVSQCPNEVIDYTGCFGNRGGSIYTQAHTHRRRFLINARYVDPGKSWMHVRIAGKSG